MPHGIAATIEPLVFAIIADPHCVETPSAIRHGRGIEHLGDGAARLSLCFDAIRALAPPERPDFVLLLGDIGIENAEPVLGGCPCPIHAVAGNHDWGPRRQRLRELFPSDFGTREDQSDYYSFEHRGVRFIAICNAGIGNEHVGQFSSEDIRPPGQVDWLVEQLGTSDTLNVVLGHCPPEPERFDRKEYLASSSHDYLPFIGECDSSFLNRLLREQEATVAFFGHLHRATWAYQLGASWIHALRSCNWNHDAAPVGFALVRIKRGRVAIREVLTGSYRRSSRSDELSTCA